MDLLKLELDRECIELMIGTSSQAADKFLNKEFNDITFMSDNLETVAHYYEGAVVLVKVVLDQKAKTGYVRSTEESRLLGMSPETYGWGCAEMLCPEGATWYSFSKQYLQKHVISVTLAYPDLSAYFEEE